MDTVTISPKYQVVIPASIRSHLKVKPGEKVVVMEKDGIIHIVPVEDMRSMRGRYKSGSTEAVRDDRDRV